MVRMGMGNGINLWAGYLTRSCFKFDERSNPKNRHLPSECDIVQIARLYQLCSVGGMSDRVKGGSLQLDSNQFLAFVY